jgi:hypothetical protein
VSGDYAIGWGTLSLLNAGLAQAKGRSGRLWFLGSLFVGPLATLLLVLSPMRFPVESPDRPGPAAGES